MISWIAIPVGTTLAGVITEAWGAVIYFLFAGCVLSLVCIVFIKTKLYRIDEMNIEEEVQPLRAVSSKE
jgi:hypothetical protein